MQVQPRHSSPQEHRVLLLPRRQLLVRGQVQVRPRAPRGSPRRALGPGTTRAAHDRAPSQHGTARAREHDRGGSRVRPPERDDGRHERRGRQAFPPVRAGSRVAAPAPIRRLPARTRRAGRLGVRGRGGQLGVLQRGIGQGGGRVSQEPAPERGRLPRRARRGYRAAPRGAGRRRRRRRRRWRR